MNANRQTTVMKGNNKESNMKITASNLIRWAGLAAMVAGICYVVVGLFHPPNVLSSVTTTQWAIVHVLASAMCFFGILGMAGLYARQAEKSGWLGLAGFVLLSLWFAFILGFSFVETFILPSLATTAPKFVAGFLGVLTGTPSEVSLGAIPVVNGLLAVLYLLGTLLFGIALFRARTLSRWAAGLLAVSGPLAIIMSLLPHQIARLAAMPMGFALIWLGYALWSERRAPAVEPLPGRASLELSPTGAE